MRISIIKGNFLGLVIWWTLNSNCSISLPRDDDISKLDFSQINAYVYCLYKYFCDFTLAAESSTGKVKIKAELKTSQSIVLALPVQVDLLLLLTASLHLLASNTGLTHQLMGSYSVVSDVGVFKVE